MKSILLAFVAVVLVSIHGVAEAHGGHRPPPPPRPNPYPPYPQPYYVTCFAQGMYNGVIFYGTGPNTFVANQWALYACQSTGQYCQMLGCRY